MPSYKMRVHLDYPVFDFLSEDRKSLINFIMENGAAYFRGEYDGDTLLHMAGTVRPTTRILGNGFYTREGDVYDVNIMYTKTSRIVFLNNDNEVIVLTLNNSLKDKGSYYFEAIPDGSLSTWILYKENTIVAQAAGYSTSDMRDTFLPYLSISPYATNIMGVSFPKTQFPDPGPFSTSLLPDGGDSIPHAEKDSFEFDIDTLHYEDGIIDCNTVLCETMSNLTLFATSTIKGDNTYWPTAEVVVDDKNIPILQIPVTLSPKIGNIINDNANIKPTFIMQKETSPDGLHVCEIPIDKEDMDFQYDLQLRTQDFWLRHHDPEDETAFVVSKVFYKMGVLSLDNQIPKDSIVSYLEDRSLVLARDTQSWYPVSGGEPPYCVSFTLNNDTPLTWSLLYYNHEMYVEQRIGSYSAGGIARSFISSLVVYDTGQPVGLIYFKLYTYDGTDIVPFDYPVEDSQFELRETEQGSSVSTLILSIAENT